MNISLLLKRCLLRTFTYPYIYLCHKSFYILLEMIYKVLSVSFQRYHIFFLYSQILSSRVVKSIKKDISLKLLRRSEVKIRSLSLSLSRIHQVCPRGSVETARRNVVKQTHNTDELAVNVIIRGSIGAHPSNDPFKHLTTLNHREPLQFFPWHRQRPHSPSHRDSFVCFWLS